MTADTPESLEKIARADPYVAPLAALQAEAIQAFSDPAWERSVPPLEGSFSPARLPILHGRTIVVDAGAVGQLLSRLVEVSSSERTEPLRRALDGSDFDPLPLLEATINQDTGEIAKLATMIGADSGLLMTFGQLAGMPLLQAWNRRAAVYLEGVVWEAGYCPVCASWPTLAETRGTSRQRWLRCGYCGAQWSHRHGSCVFCDNSNHESLGYLASASEWESRRAETCDRCEGYIKSVASLTPLKPEEIAIQDLSTVELDLEAIKRGYGRPERPGFLIRVKIVPK